MRHQICPDSPRNTCLVPLRTCLPANAASTLMMDEVRNTKLQQRNHLPLGAQSVNTQQLLSDPDLKMDPHRGACSCQANVG